MDRSTALRILGLDAQQAPSDELVEGAYWRLRAHLERRVDDAASAPERAARLAELAQLRTALHGSAGAAEGEPEVAAADEPRLPRWLLVWASGASALAILLALLLFFAATQPPPRPATSVAGAGAAPGGVAGELLDAAADAAVAVVAAESGEAADGETAGAPLAVVPGGGASAGPAGAAAVPPLEPALLVAKANLPNSRLQIARSSDRATIFEGAADATEHSLPPGRYVLSVSNPECTDRWESEVALAPGERRRVDPRNCERNGWLVVRSNVSGDSVAIDARPVGASGTTRHPVSVGEHRVLVQKKGYVPWEGVTRVAPAEEVTLRAQLFEAADAAAASAQPASQRGASPAERDSKLSGPWHDQTERWLLGRYDRDVSGRIDTPAEVRGIECRDLLDIEGTYDRAEFGIPLTRFFGFDGTGFVDGALGFDRVVRDIAYTRMKACGLR